MASFTPRTLSKAEVTRWQSPNQWDVIALLLLVIIIFFLGWGAKSMSGHYQPGEPIQIHLSPAYLPYYALRTVLRMFIALILALLFTFSFGTLAAKSRQAERVLIPLIDILQSIPILGFLSITVVGFIALFPGSLLGPECAAIFAIFVSQVWNMTLSFYQSLRAVPLELQEAAAIFQLSAWQKFWRIEVPYALPGLLWNTMMSMSSSWVFLVASESMSIANSTITLPGIGSYTSLAIQQANVYAIVDVIITMLVVIALYDQLLFRPLVAWAEKFKAEATGSEVVPTSWVLDLYQRTRLCRFLGYLFNRAADALINIKFLRKRRVPEPSGLSLQLRSVLNWGWNILLFALLCTGCLLVANYLFTTVSAEEIRHVLFLGFITALRVTVVLFLSSLLWVPLGVWIGLRPKASLIIQPIIQFLAAFPAYLFFPIVVMAIVKYQLNVEIWTSPLMILGTQWYIAFNVIAGAIALPKNLHYAVDTLQVKGWLWWKRFILPAIFPYYITGAITAAGGAWNVSIIAEAVQWGPHQLYATGLGSYITQVSHQGDFPKLALGIVVMSLYVVLINRAIWRPLYRYAEERFQLF